MSGETGHLEGPQSGDEDRGSLFLLPKSESFWTGFLIYLGYWFPHLVYIAASHSHIATQCLRVNNRRPREIRVGNYSLAVSEHSRLGPPCDCFTKRTSITLEVRTQKLQTVPQVERASTGEAF